MAPTPAKLLLAAAAVVCNLPAAATNSTDSCDPGYQDNGLRWATGLGRITITTTHEECRDRCSLYSGAEYLGGCKGYMTGMYLGSLYCRSYGGTSTLHKPCAPWATRSSAGSFSGELGTIHVRTGQLNIGGSCCMNETAWVPKEVVLDVPSSSNAAAAMGTSVGATDWSGATGSIIIATIAIISLTVLAAVLKALCRALPSDGQGSEGPQANESGDVNPTTVINPHRHVPRGRTHRALAPGHGETWV